MSTIHVTGGWLVINSVGVEALEAKSVSTDLKHRRATMPRRHPHITWQDFTQLLKTVWRFLRKSPNPHCNANAVNHR